MLTCMLQRYVAFSLTSTQTFQRVLMGWVEMHREKEWPFSGISSSGRVWRKVPESEAWSVGL